MLTAETIRARRAQRRAQEELDDELAQWARTFRELDERLSTVELSVATLEVDCSNHEERLDRMDE